MTTPGTKTIDAGVLTQDSSWLLDAVSREEARVVLEGDGRAVAALISVSDLERLQRFEAQRRQDFQALERTWEAFKDVPDAELKREVQRAVAEVRSENRPSAPRSADPS